MSQPFLYSLFNELRGYREWVAPGLREYYLLFDILRSKKYPVESFDEFTFILETIWTKSLAQREKFREILEGRKKGVLIAMNAMRNDLVAEKESNKKNSGFKKGKEKKTIHGKEDVKEPLPPQPTITGKSIKSEKKNPLDGNWERPGGVGFSIDKASQGILPQSIRLKDASQPEEVLLHESPFLFTNDYFPLRKRQLQQAWRNLKSRQEGSDGPEISIGKTIEEISQRGYFTGFNYEKQLVNQLKLFILLDQSDSMIAMEEFGKELYQSARESELHKNLKPWYFQGLPHYDETTQDYSFISEDGTKSTTLRKLFWKQSRNDIVVMIYSDAGALKNEMNKERIKSTIDFLTDLNNRCAYMAWINPAPKQRWANTNAAIIEKNVLMFETSRIEIENAIAVLKGKES